MIVIDVGCARYGGDYSIERLIEEFYPDQLYGFDPNWPEDEGNVIHSLSHPTTTLVERSAAWIYDGEIGFRADGLNSWVTELRGAPQVPCVDMARFIVQLDSNDIVLKLDCEGSEYDILRHLIAKRVDPLLKLAIVEWHEPDRGRAIIEEELACPIREWPH